MNPIGVAATLSTALALLAAAGCGRSSDAPATGTVETTGATIPAVIGEPPAPPLEPRIQTEWTPNGPRVRTAPDLHDMGMHHPPEGRPFSAAASTVCEPEPMDRCDPVPPR